MYVKKVKVHMIREVKQSYEYKSCINCFVTNFRLAGWLSVTI